MRRPKTGARELLQEGRLDLVEGLVGDNWSTRGSSLTPDGLAHPDMQLNIMNSRVVALVAQQLERWALAGDQLFVDFDLSDENVPPGTRLRAWFGGHRSHQTAPYWLCQICGAIRIGRYEVRELRRREAASPAGH